MTAPLTREKIEALREAARKAGGREWFVDSRPNDDGTAQVDDGTSGMFPITAEWPQALYIAAASPSTILSLCDMAEAGAVRVKPLVWSDSMVFGTRKWRGSGAFGEFFSFSGNDLTPEEIATRKIHADGLYAAIILSTLGAGQTDRVGELVAALRWYEAQARGCRKITSEGDVARNALAADGGNRARAALSKAQEDGE